MKLGKLGKVATSAPNTASNRASIGNLVNSLILTRAATLARNGDLKQAESLLKPLADEPDAPSSTLDLLAKIYAQQWKTAEAQALWLRALQTEPSNKHFLRALIRCADLRGEKP